MIILLKIILALIAVADGFSLKFIFDEYRKTTKQDGYDELPIWRKIRFNVTTYFIMSAMVSLFAFLAYFIIAKITLG
jgi:hypothetical protein